MKTELILVGKTVNKHFIAGIKDYACLLYTSTALVAAFRTEVDDIVGTLDDIQIVLNHYQRMTRCV